MKNIIFDLGSVILRKRSFSTLDKLDLDDNTYNELKRFFENCTTDVDLGKKTLEEKFNECNFSKELEDKYKDYLLHYYEHRDINMDLINLINRLKEKGYILCILSETNYDALNYYKNNELFKSIDYWTGSCEHGALKSEGTLFDIFLSKYNLNPEECFFVDDKEINIIEARKRKITAHLFDENEDIKTLYEDMIENGIDLIK